jgi:hypothetical protein
MDCPICNRLLLVYKRAINVYVDAEEKIAERYVSNDNTAGLEEAERLRLACRDASDAFMEHWQQHHRVFAAKAASAG